MLMLMITSILLATLVEQFNLNFIKHCGNSVEAARFRCVSNGETEMNDILTCINDGMQQSDIDSCKMWLKEAAEAPTDNLPLLSDAQKAQFEEIGRMMATSTDRLIPDHCPKQTTTSLRKREEPKIVKSVREWSFHAFKTLFGLYFMAVQLGYVLWYIPAGVISSLLAFPILLFFGTNQYQFVVRQCLDILLIGYSIATGFAPLMWLGERFATPLDGFLDWWQNGPKVEEIE
eukprot:NODE_619_length_5349_cov_0.609524.p2 type:complete len:232 gc:universal NODE_619_length_5349_cov_0.609524:2339-1644(-)